MKWPFMLKETHNRELRRALIQREREIILAQLDEINRARLVFHDIKCWQSKLQQAARTGHHCDASIAADAVAQSIEARMRPNA